MCPESAENTTARALKMLMRARAGIFGVDRRRGGNQAVAMLADRKSVHMT